MSEPKYLSDANAPFTEIQNQIEALAGGKSLASLINEGLLRRADGTPFDPVDPEEENQREYIGSQNEALEAASNGGVFLFTSLRSSTPKPHFISGNGKQIVCEEFLEPNEVEKKVGEAMGLPKRPDVVKRPGFFNRLRNFFSKNGTPEMNAYKQYQADLQRYNELSVSVTENYQMMSADLHDMAARHSADVHTAKDFRQVIAIGTAVKDRYQKLNPRPCEAVNRIQSQIGDLRNDTINSLEPVVTGIGTKFILEPQKVTKGLAAMTAMDVIMRERVANGYKKASDAPVIPGPIEQKLNKVGSAQFIKMIAENEVFKAQTSDMNSKKLEDFVTKNQAYNLAADVTNDILKNEMQKFGITDEDAAAAMEKNDVITKTDMNKSVAEKAKEQGENWISVR